MSNQRVEQDWETPTLDEIVVISRGHVEAMESSDDELIWSPGGMAHLLLTTVGRKSGRTHKVALPMWRDPDGHRIVVASFAGATRHPAWYLNLTDTTANGSVVCQVPGRRFVATPEILDGEEYDRIWALLVADRAWYVDYQAKTDRRIPLVRLAETAPTQ